MGYKKIEEKVAIKDKLTLTIPEVAEYTNIGINKLQELCHSKDRNLFVLECGGKTLIKRKAFEKYIEDTVYI